MGVFIAGSAGRMSVARSSSIAFTKTVRSEATELAATSLPPSGDFTMAPTMVGCIAANWSGGMA